MPNRLFVLPEANQENKFSSTHPSAVYYIAGNVRSVIREVMLDNRPVIVLCIGTDRSTGDALGPLTGSKLKALRLYPHVYGTLDDPVHATNLTERLSVIEAQFPKPFIIAVDACLGRKDSVGCVSVGRGPLKPGAAVNKNLPPVGDVYITGIVNVGGFMEQMVLQSTRLSLVFNMAETIARGIGLGLCSSSFSR